MGDDQVALFAADHLSQAPWWDLPAGAHLRLLNVLCYDVAQVSHTPMSHPTMSHPPTHPLRRPSRVDPGGQAFPSLSCKLLALPC